MFPWKHAGLALSLALAVSTQPAAGIAARALGADPKRAGGEPGGKISGQPFGLAGNESAPAQVRATASQKLDELREWHAVPRPADCSLATCISSVPQTKRFQTNPKDMDLLRLRRRTGRSARTQTIL